MRKLSIVLVSGLFAANLAVTAQAADYGSPGMAMEKMKGDGMMMGKHKMSGTVDKIDHAKGTLVLKSGMADMSLHFPPPSLKDLKNGDTITVELSFAKSEPPMK